MEDNYYSTDENSGPEDGPVKKKRKTHSKSSFNPRWSKQWPCIQASKVLGKERTVCISLAMPSQKAIYNCSCNN